MRLCRAQPLSYRLGGRSSGQSWLSCVPTMQAYVESHVSKGAKRGAAGLIPYGVISYTTPLYPLLPGRPPYSAVP
jgi:hypothetical protein